MIEMMRWGPECPPIASASREALEGAGVRFTEEDGANYGVRLEKKPPRR
jgi:hypothetical protein